MKTTENKPPHTADESFGIGVRKAQLEMRKRGGPKAGEVVTHLSDKDVAYTFRKAKGKIGFVYLPANLTAHGREIEKQFPLDELFNPNDATRFSIEDTCQSQLSFLLRLINIS